MEKWLRCLKNVLVLRLDEDIQHQNIQNKGGVGGNGRKMVELEAVLDYDYAGPNTKHDPRGRKGGNGKNP
nr:hypothetical protein Saspl_019698 [Ipomoea batatas]